MTGFDDSNYIDPPDDCGCFEQFLEDGGREADDMSQAAHDAIDERLRQQDKEGWTTEHDDQHTDGSLAMVAAVYAVPDRLLVEDIAEYENGKKSYQFSDPWPASWGDGWDKRGIADECRLLVMSGSLILAEIERLDRVAKKETAS